jgi:hypothetical protein
MEVLNGRETLFEREEEKVEACADGCEVVEGDERVHFLTMKEELNHY